MSRCALIAALNALAREPDRLARAIHASWCTHRLAEGWMFGPADQDARTSPYLKPLSDFSPGEMERELRLSLNDLAGIAETLEGFDSGPQLEALFEAADGRATLLHLRDDIRFVEQASVRIHDGWRKENLRIGTSAHDARLNFPFEQLSLAARAITLSNVQADIEAIAGLLTGGTR